MRKGIIKTFTGKVSDVEGNVYYTVTVNNRVWMAENLKTTKYANGSPIALLESQSSWYASTDTAMAYCCIITILTIRAHMAHYITGEEQWKGIREL